MVLISLTPSWPSPKRWSIAKFRLTILRIFNVLSINTGHEIGLLIVKLKFDLKMGFNGLYIVKKSFVELSVIIPYP